MPLVGLLLAAASWMMAGPWLPRVLVLIAAAAWLSGSLSPWLLLAHQGVLLLALLAAESGKVRGWDRLVAALSVPIALGMLEQPVVGACLCASVCGRCCGARPRRTVSLPPVPWWAEHWPVRGWCPGSTP